MSWDKVKKAVGRIAPLLGNAIAPGAGGLAGALVAQALGVENEPSAVEQALTVDPNAAIKLRDIEAQERTTLARISAERDIAAIQGETQQQRNVNETMQVEAKAEKWWTSAWRPFIGFITGIAFLMVCAFVGYVLVEAIQTAKLMETLSQIPTIVTAFTGLFSVPCAILGIAAHHRGQMQRAQTASK